MIKAGRPTTSHKAKSPKRQFAGPILRCGQWSLAGGRQLAGKDAAFEVRLREGESDRAGATRRGFLKADN